MGLCNFPRHGRIPSKKHSFQRIQLSRIINIHIMSVRVTDDRHFNIKTNYDIGTNTVKKLLSCKVLSFVTLWNTWITLIFMPDLFSALYENISITPSNLPVRQPSIVNRLNTSSLSQRKPLPSRTPTNVRNSCKKRLRKKCTIINIVHVLTKT